MMDSSVDLPEPLAPTTDTKLPRAMVSRTESSARTGRSRPGKSLLTPSISSSPRELMRAAFRWESC
jgi:hypothetical protein